MSDKRISELTELTAGNISSSDVMPIVDVSDPTHAPSGTTKKVLLSALAAFIGAAPGSVVIEWVDLIGDVDGVNAEFTLADPPTNDVLEVSMARQQQFEGLDYTYDGDVTITFVTPPDASLATEPLKALVY